MKQKDAIKLSLVVGAASLALAGCSHPSEPCPISSHYYPGTTAGQAVGTGVGVVAGNVAGFGAGFAGGFWHGASAPFETPTTRIVRTWRTETTADGRTIQVPVELAVDELGRPQGSVPESMRAAGEPTH